MGGQRIERRDLVRMIAMASVGGPFQGFSRWVFAYDHGKHKDSQARANQPYHPVFFTAQEFLLVDRLAELIIPADQSPGAHDAGVAEFIDFMVFNGADLSAGGHGAVGDRFRLGFKWINARCTQLYGHAFLHCSQQQQTELLEHLAYQNSFRSGEEEGQAFFQLMRDYTVKGYYTSKIGLEELEYPGLQTVWPAMPGCPHKDDPEHLHLPPPVN